MLRFILAVLFTQLATAATAPTCVGGVAVASVKIMVQPGGKVPMPLRKVNNLLSSYRISYQPVDLPADLKQNARLTLVAVPKKSDGAITVLDPRAASGPAEWRVPDTPHVLLVVYGPNGLDEKRITNLVTKDEALVAALADYADQTANLEAGLEAANELDDIADDDNSRPARPLTPAEQAIFALVRSLNPGASGYNPLGVGRRAGSATPLGKGAETFFDNAGGIFPGSGALPIIKTWLMPDTEFRSVYAIPKDPDGLTFCAQVAAKTRNRVAYLWAYRLNGATMPVVKTLKDDDMLTGMRSSLPVKVTAEDWPLLDHVVDWALSPNQGIKPQPIPVRPVPEERTLHLDLRKFAGAPGDYHLEARWDWDTLRVPGTLHVYAPDNLKTARLTPESQDRLIAGSGAVDLDLTGANFLFIEDASVRRASFVRKIPVDLPEVRKADSLRVDLDTNGLDPGPYLLELDRADGATADIPLRVLPAPPRIDGVRLVNVGVAEQEVVLAGSGLDRIEGLESDRAQVMLKAASADGTRRPATVRLRAEAKPGDLLALAGPVQGMSGPLRFPGALQVAAARPRIREAKPSAPEDLAIALRDQEIPAGSWTSYALTVEPADASGSITLACADGSPSAAPVVLRLGEKQANAQLTSAGSGTWFLSLDAGSVGPTGCGLTAVVETSAGKSDVFALGKVVRLPRIESFAMTDEKSPDGYFGVLKGFDLESIAQTAWAAGTGVAVTELPRPIPGEGSKQTLRISMPWPSPSPKAPLFVWLRGDTDARSTKITP